MPTSLKIAGYWRSGYNSLALFGMNYISNIRNKLILWEGLFWQNHRDPLSPSILQFDYLSYLSIYQSIQKNFKKISKGDKHKFKIVDIGCGDKPYKSLFKIRTKSYVGVDLREDADIYAAGENLPVKDRSFDLAVCFQVLEHCNNPEKVVSEMKRVLQKGGYVMVSTHGIWPFHPGPHDYYRWTHEGLRKLFKGFSQVEVTPTMGSYATMIQLVNIELFSLAYRNLLLKFPLLIVMVSLNILGKLILHKGLDHISINYFVLGKVK